MAERINRTMRLNLRLTEDESTRLRALAASHDLTMSKYVRQQIFIDRQEEWLKRIQADIRTMRNEIVLAGRRYREMDLVFAGEEMETVLASAEKRLEEIAEVMERYGSNSIKEHQAG